jgi:WD40 repeat protein
VSLYSVSTSEKIDDFQVHNDACVGLAFSPCGTFCVSIGQDDKLAVVDVRSRRAVLHRCGHPQLTAFQDSSFPSISLDSRIASVCSAADGNVYCFELSQGTLLGKAATSDAVCVLWAAKNPTDFEMLTAHKGGALKWWDASEQIL